MSIEDRVRAATRARADLVRQVRPLELPDELPARGRRSRRARRGRPAHPTRSARHWLNWGAPLAAAALVTALALALVLLRQAPVPPSHPVAPTSAPSIPASVPRYYAVLAPAGGVLVGDDRTGRTVANVSAPAAQDFTGVTAAADDRTFVVSDYDNFKAETTWYLLRITPGAAHPARLTPLPIAPLRAKINGLALSQDGRELAVMFDGSTLQLSTYSVSTGALLGSWHTNADHWILRTGGDNAYGLSWLADGRHIAFRFDDYAKNSDVHLVTVRTLDLAAAGPDLLAGSRLDLQVPLSVTQPAVTEPCPGSLAAPDGRSVVCGTAVPAGLSQASCTDVPPSFVSYSTATGERTRVLYQDPRPCPGIEAVPLWTNASASQVIGLISGAVTASRAGAPAVGLIAAGHFTPFPGLDDPVLLTDLGAIAF